MDVEETTHNDEQEKSEAPFENIALEIWHNTKNQLLKQAIVVTEQELSQRPIWNPIEKKKIWYHEIVLSNPYIWEAEILHLHKWINELLQSQEKDASKDWWNDHLLKMNWLMKEISNQKIQKPFFSMLEFMSLILNPPIFFDHGTRCVIASCPYWTTCVLTIIALPSMWPFKL